MENEARSVLVTGANRGLGREVALRLAREGLFVWVGARHADKAREVVEAIEQSGGRAEALTLDVQSSTDIERAVERIQQRSGKLDVLVNNAGVMIEGEWVGNTSATVDQETLQKTFGVNLFAVVAVTQAFLPLLKQSGDASIVNVSSVMGSLAIHAQPEGPLAYTKPFAYDASKAALNAFTVHLAYAVASAGILVNSAHPGWVRTELGTSAADLSIEEGAQSIVELALLRRGGPTAQFLHAGSAVPF